MTAQDGVTSATISPLVQAVARALANLPPEHVACLLGHAEGLTYADLSQTLDCSVAAVKQRIYRARLAFRAAYAAESRDAASPPATHRAQAER